jgi:hypothetical protein
MKSKISLLLAVFSLYFLTFTMVYGLSLQSYPWPWVYVSNAVLSEEFPLEVATTSPESFFTSSSTPAEVDGSSRLVGGGEGSITSIGTNLETDDMNHEDSEEILEETEESQDSENLENPIGSEQEEDSLSSFFNQSGLVLDLSQTNLFSGNSGEFAYGPGFAERLGFLFVLERLFRNNGSGVLGGEGSLLGNLLILDQLFR